MIIVADSSPLISFAVLDQLNLLSKIFDELYVPEAVYEEVVGWEKPYSNELKEFLEGKVKSVRNRLAMNVLSNELDTGEAEAIVLALENNISDILIDEHKGRRLARSNGLHPIGSIGVLIQAKKAGYIEKLKPCLDKLIENKIRISKALYNHALTLAGEQDRNKS